MPTTDERVIQENDRELEFAPRSGEEIMRQVEGKITLHKLEKNERNAATIGRIFRSGRWEEEDEYNRRIGKHASAMMFSLPYVTYEGQVGSYTTYWSAGKGLPFLCAQHDEHGLVTVKP